MVFLLLKTIGNLELQPHLVNIFSRAILYEASFREPASQKRKLALTKADESDAQEPPSKKRRLNSVGESSSVPVKPASGSVSLTSVLGNSIFDYSLNGPHQTPLTSIVVLATALSVAYKIGDEGEIWLPKLEQNLGTKLENLKSTTPPESKEFWACCNILLQLCHQWLITQSGTRFLAFFFLR